MATFKRNEPRRMWRPFAPPPPPVRSTRDGRAAHYDQFLAPSFADPTAACVREAEAAAARALQAGQSRQQALAVAGQVADWWAAPQDEPDRQTSPDDIARAQVICRTRCPLQRTCADYADASSLNYGVWGGVDRNPTDRKARRSA
jgi:hypothetical protein